MTFAACFILAEVLPVICFVFGIILHKHEPKQINYLFGYRTARSMKNDDTWRFANNLLGRIWLWGGAVLIVVSAAAMLLMKAFAPDTLEITAELSALVQTALMLISIFPVESALKKRFSNDGSRREDGSRE